MNLTVDHILQVFYEKLSAKRLERFTMTDLIRASSVHKSTIYRYYQDINHLCNDAIQKLIIEPMFSKCESFNEVLMKLIGYIENNRIFCLNLFHLFDPVGKREKLIDFFKMQLHKFEIGEEFHRKYIISDHLLVLNQWFHENLVTEGEQIISQLLVYEKLIQKFGTD